MIRPESRRQHLTIVAAIVALVGIGATLTFPVLRCADSCFVDYFAIHDGQTAHFEMPDARLNAWILAWVHHGLFTQPAALFDTNAFHPAANTLAGSEHMLGVALPLLPLQLVAGGPVLLHQAALILSFVVLALTSFALVRWTTGSSWAAFLAGAAAPFMPWRYSELGHLQLLSVQWLPLVWLFTARALRVEARRRDAVWLAAALCLQMLSSFYLAYLTVFSTAVLAAVLLVTERPPVAAIRRFAVAALLPSALVAISAIPYLTRFSAYRFSEASATEFVTSPHLVLGLLKPPGALRADLAGIAPLTYHVPAIVLLCAVLAAAWLGSRNPAPGRERRTRNLVAALWIATGGAFVLMLGRTLEVGGLDIPLPAHWLAQLVPGFSQMRAEFRWGIVIGVAAPVLAGAGIAWLERRLAAGFGGQREARGAIWLSRVAVGALFAVNIHWFELPGRDAWSEGDDIVAAHRALATLAPGPVVELPWNLHRISIASIGSQYMLASAQHWQPLLNGYTAYLPPSHHFLQRLAQDLPDPAVLVSLQRLTGLRWIIVHPDRLGIPQRHRWAEAERLGLLSPTVAAPGFRIYEVPAAPGGPSWQAELLASEPGDTTMTGLPRSPLEVPDEPGRLSVEAPGRMRYQSRAGLPQFATVTLEHAGDATWPGLDIQTEGLVLLRYRFFTPAGELVQEDVASFDRDLPPRQTNSARALLLPPARAGRFRVEYDVVQRLGDELRSLGLPTAEGRVEISERVPQARGD
jgi:hypothetical protein